MTCSRHPDGDPDAWWCMDCHPERYPAAATQAHARTTDPWTSHDAARSISEEELRESERCVLACFRVNGEMHHEKLVERYREGRFLHGWKPQRESGLRTRTSDMKKAGYIRDTGKVVILDSGRSSIVWAAV